MGERQRRVFISSVGGPHLSQYREASRAVCLRLGLQPIAMEEFGPETPPPLEVCLRRVEDADAFVCLVAHRYGSRPPASAMSFTEHEYECAVRRGIPVHLYVVDPGLPWPPNEMDHGADREALEAFKNRIRTHHTVRVLRDVVTFREDLMLYLGGLAGGPAKDDEREKTPEVPQAPAPHYVPRYVSTQPFTGRREELAALDSWGRSSDPILVVEAIGGNGKSALTWQWSENHAFDCLDGLEGRLWWSFYEGAASMRAFLIDATSYVTGRPRREVGALSRAEQTELLLRRLRSTPFLLVLDGAERLLRAYHRFDPTKLRDDAVNDSARGTINHHDSDLLRQLSTCHPSKVLVSSRLFPLAFDGPTHLPIPGVRRLSLPGLATADVLRLLDTLGVNGSPEAIQRFFERLGNHPLVVGVVAGIVRDYRSAPGNFDRWVGDRAAAGSLGLEEPDLVRRLTQILGLALDRLDPESSRLLGWLSVLSESVSFATLASINPFRDDLDTWTEGLFDRDPTSNEQLDEARLQHVAYDATAGEDDMPPSPEARLDRALTNLEERGLLWWDRSSNTYDLHPVVRAYAFDRLETQERVEANVRIHDHFSGLPPEDPAEASSVDDLRQTITVFRALVGAGRHREAVDLFNARLSDVLSYPLNAFSTILELLGPLRNSELDSRSNLMVLNMIANALTPLRRTEEAAKLHEAGLRLALRDGHLVNVSTLLNNASTSYKGHNAVLAADRANELALLAARALGPESAEPIVLLTRANHLWRRGETEGARETMRKFMRGPRPSHSRVHPGEPEMIDCAIALAEGRLSHEMIQEAMDLGPSPYVALQLTRLQVDLSADGDDLSEAARYAERAIALARNLEIPSQDYEGALARFLAEMGQLPMALGIVDDVLTRAAYSPRVTFPHVELGTVFLEAGQHDRAREHALKAFELAWADGPPFAQQRRLDQATVLLRRIGAELPVLRVVDPDTFALPFEREVRDLIRKHGSSADYGF